MASSSHIGNLLIFVGPTCVGKSTLIRALQERIPNAGLLVSVTTRPMRQGEVNGVHYHFVTDEAFVASIEAGEFYEAVERGGYRYGSSKRLVEQLRAGHTLVLGDLNVEGAHLVKEMTPDMNAVFLVPDTMDALNERLHLRGTSDKEIAIRLGIADEEMKHVDDFDAKIVNVDGKFEDTVAQALDLIRAKFPEVAIG